LEKTIKFLEYRYIGYAITLAMFIIFSAGTVIHGGFNWGIDFVGGVKIIAKFEKKDNVTAIRNELAKNNVKAEVQQYGKEDENAYVISTRLTVVKEEPVQEKDEKAPVPTPLTSKDKIVNPKDAKAPVSQLTKTKVDTVKPMDAKTPVSTLAKHSEQIKKEFDIIEGILQKNFSNVKILNREDVGPSIGDYLKKSAIKLILACVAVMGVYLAFRFEAIYAIGAIIGISHDVALSFLYCGLMNIEINIPIIAGILTIFGFSMHDTIIVYDRIRENVKIITKQAYMEIVDKSITQTIKRTILTTLTTLMASICLYMIGEDVIHDFALLLIFGFSTGVFSTVAVSAPIVNFLHRHIKVAE
jgi:preprotein translocase subunit SecF